MTAVAHLNALYSAARIIIWVEDPVTRDYLTFARLPITVTGWTQPGAVLAALQTAEANYNTDLASGNWLVEFSGKEIFRRVRDYVYQPPQNPGTPDSDFAKAIGEWQQANNQIPADLAQLRSALRFRVGLTP